jgi:hypothetical protein
LAVLASAVLVGVVPSRASTPSSATAARPASTERRRALDGGVRLEARTTFTLDPSAGAVHVALDATITNQRRDQVSGGTITQYYLPSVRLPVLSEAVGVAAVKSDGTVLPVSTEATESPRFVFAVVDLRPNLYYPGSQTIRLTYDLPQVEARSEGFTRLNDAYATFPMLAIGDAGISGVEVVIPAQFDVELVGDEMTQSERDGQQVFTADAIADPASWLVQVSARDDSKLIERTVDLGDEEVRVLGWPGDAAWAEFTAAQVEDGVPAIEEVLGVPWPAPPELEVVETASPYLYGYGGWYRRLGDLIEIGDELDQQVILHELSHLWFNDTLFEGRWINEGFANEVAALAMAELGAEPPEPEPVDPADPGLLKLNDWSAPDLQGARTDDQERYGYNTSWSVVSAIGQEIGPDRLAAVVQAADAGQAGYPGPGDRPTSTRIYDWRELLDLLEGTGGSTTATDLFERHVVTAAQASDLADRSAARARFAALVAAGDGWAAPLVVRSAMTDWSFARAEDLIDAATDVLGTKAEVAEVATDLEVAEDLALQDEYEGASDLGRLQREADEALAAALALQSAEDARDAGAGPLGVVGLLRSSVDEDLARAATAFDRGDYAAVRAGAESVEATMDGALLGGLVRLAGLAAAAAAVWLLRRSVRARAARRAAQVGSEAAELEPDGAEGVGRPPDGRGEGGV